MTASQWRTLTHFGAYNLAADADGSIAEVEPVDIDPDHSPIGRQLVGDRGRLARPMVRRSWLDHGVLAHRERRGDDDLVEVDWSTALDFVEQALRAVIDTHGNGAVFGGSYGWASAGRFHHAQSQLKRFLNCIGGYVGSIGTYSHGAAEVVAPAVTGLSLSKFFKVAPPADQLVQHTETLISFGGYPAANTQITSGGDATHWYRPALEAAKQNGCRLVAIAPNRTRFDEQLGASWLAVRPGTDTALMLGLVHELAAADPQVGDRLRRFGAGADALLAYLAGDTDGIPKDGAWAAATCGLELAQFNELLTLLQAPDRVLVNATWSTQRVPHGEHAVWALIALGLAIGQMGEPGGGIAFGLGSMGSVGRSHESPRLASVPQGANPVDDAIPVARITDALLNPGGQYSLAGETRTYPQLELLYWAGGNPFHHHQDLFRLDQAWRRPAAVVVHEPYLTATAQRADVVLPSTVGWERNDVGGASTGGHLVAMQARPGPSPAPEARHDFDIFCSLAERFGVLDRFSEGRNADEWIRWLYEENRQRDAALPDWATFQRDGMAPRSLKSPVSPLRDFLADPEGAPLDTPSGRIQLGLKAAAGVPPHPMWRGAQRHSDPSDLDPPLYLISPMPENRLHSQLSGADDGPAPAFLHPTDAQRLGFEAGAEVSVVSDHGAFAATVSVTDTVRPGVVLVYNGRWFEPQGQAASDQHCARGNANAATSDEGTSGWAQACAAHACPVVVLPA